MREIDQKIVIAQEALNEAESISEKYGVPFYSNVSPLGQDYRPASFDEKWNSPIDEIDEYDLDLPEYEGWQHSMVC